MKFEVIINKKAISRKEIHTPNIHIPAGGVFNLIDGYKEDDLIIIGIGTKTGIDEAGFKIPYGMTIESEQDVYNYIHAFLIN